MKVNETINLIRLKGVMGTEVKQMTMM